MDQAVKNIEDMQDDFDFCYKTLQSRGERRSDLHPKLKRFSESKRYIKNEYLCNKCFLFCFQNQQTEPPKR